MGSTLHTTVGYGLLIPYTDDEYEFEDNAPAEWKALFADQDPEWGRDTYEVLETLLEGYTGLSFNTAYWHDYKGDTVVFVKALRSTGYGLEVVKVPNMPEDSFTEDLVLYALAQEIGMPVGEIARNIGIWSVVSYG